MKSPPTKINFRFGLTGSSGGSGRIDQREALALAVGFEILRRAWPRPASSAAPRTSAACCRSRGSTRGIPARPAAKGSDLPDTSRAALCSLSTSISSDRSSLMRGRELRLNLHVRRVVGFLDCQGRRRGGAGRRGRRAAPPGTALRARAAPDPDVGPIFGRWPRPARPGRSRAGACRSAFGHARSGIGRLRRIAGHLLFQPFTSRSSRTTSG